MKEERKENDKRVKLNIGGHYFETWFSTLERIPGTRLALLATLKEADESYDADNGEYFFDRHPGAFMAILTYYRTEELHVDQNICGNIIKGVCIQEFFFIFLARFYHDNVIYVFDDSNIEKVTVFTVNDKIYLTSFVMKYIQL